MGIQTKFKLYIGVVFCLLLAVLSLLSYQQVRADAEREAYATCEKLVAMTAANRRYVREVLRPKMFEVFKDGEFLREGMSGSFAARKHFEFFVESFPDYYIKFASKNPRNPLNKADAIEIGIIDKFTSDPSLDKWQGITLRNNTEYMTVAKAFRFKGGCMRCHDDPVYAPPELVEIYGDQGGFGAQVGDVTIYSVGVPIPFTIASVRDRVLSSALPVLVLLAVLFVIINLFFTKIVSQPVNKLTEGVRKVTSGDYSDHVDLKGTQEFQILAVAFNALIDALSSSKIKQAAAEEKYEDLFMNAPYMYASVDAKTGNIISCNNTLLLQLGYDEDEVVDQPIFNMYHPDSLHDAKMVFQQFVEVGEVHNKQLVMRRKDGSKIDVEVNVSAVRDEQGNILHSRSVWRDITARKIAEMQLARLALVVDQSNDYIIITDIAGTIEYVNPAFTRITGYSPAEAIGQNPSFMQSGVHSEDFYKAIWDNITSGKNWSGNMTNKRKDGSLIEEHAAIFPIMNDKHEIINFAAIKRDVSDQTQIKKEKEDLFRRLQQAQKMEAIGTLAGGIAHDFNNILGVILGYTELAKDDSISGAPVQEDLDKVLTAAMRAKGLVKQILAFSRQSEVDRIPLRLQPLVKEGLKMLRSSIPSTISIVQDIDPESGVILADPTQIHQILMNLCTNAYQAMEEGGVLTVGVKTVFIGPGDHELVLDEDVDAGEYVELTVTDTGVGIGPDVLNRIFDPYFTTKGVGKGTGMGLAIIHGIMQDYGGTITVESELGKGATFHVYFPVRDGKESEIEDPEEIIGGNERILFVDDEEVLLDMAKNMLGRAGYHITAHLDSSEALKTFQKTPSDFDLVITDQTMPGMTGSDLAQRMLQVRPDIPIIICTGYSNIIDESSAKALGIREFALKPFSRDVILKLIRNVLDD